MKTKAFFLGLFILFGMPSSSFAQEPTWTQKFPATSPSGRYAHRMAYDAARRQVVLFGGGDPNSNTIFNDTWVWDGVTWTQKFPATSPPATNSHAMAYDAARQQVVLFGGSFSGIISADTWVWDGVDWTQKFPVTSPSPRLHADMAYDVAHQQVVLFGGGPGSPTGFADTWVWDGTDWTQKFPATSPPARALHQMAYDTVRGEIVLFAGTTDSTTFFNDTWIWNGTTWTQKFPATSPPGRAAHRMAYDAARQQVVLFGGANNPITLILDDTWVWDGTTWKQQVPATNPPGRHLPAMAYDEEHSQIVLFGGFTGSFSNDTWVFSSGFLSFPLKNKTAYSAAITSVFDHSMPQQYCPDGIVTAYTGEEGLDGPVTSKFKSEATRCGKKKVHLFGFPKEGGGEFTLNGQYASEEGNLFLFYDGHPGFDYRTIDQLPDGSLCFDGGICNLTGEVPVLAAAPGVVVCVGDECPEGPKAGEIKIDHENGYFSIYLHLSSMQVKVGDTVAAGDPIGTSGKKGADAPHLHFEVRKRVGDVLVPVPVDPYGWRPSDAKPDPYTRAHNIRLWK